MKTIRESNARRVSMRIAVAALVAFAPATLHAANKTSAPSKPAAAAPRPAPKATPAPTGRGAAPAASRPSVPANSRPAGPAGRGLASGQPARPGEAGRERSGVARPEGVSRTPNGAEIHRGQDGRIHEVHARGMEIRHDRSRTVVRERPGHELVVSNRFGHA